MTGSPADAENRKSVMPLTRPFFRLGRCPALKDPAKLTQSSSAEIEIAIWSPRVRGCSALCRRFSSSTPEESSIASSL